jgi:hypothetical protein
MIVNTFDELERLERTPIKMKKLFLCEFTLRVSTYMNDDDHDETYTRIVIADDEIDALKIIENRPEFKTEEYAVYRNVINFEASEAIVE